MATSNTWIVDNDGYWCVRVRYQITELVTPEKETTPWDFNVYKSSLFVNFHSVSTQCMY